LVQQSVALTVAADSAQQKDQQLIEQAVALTVAAQNVQAQPTLVATIPPTVIAESPTAESVPLPGSSDSTPTAENVPLPEGPTLTPPAGNIPVSESECQTSPQGPVPQIISVSPQEGSSQGGTAITINGKNFLSGGTKFNFGANPATQVKCDSDSQCTMKSPAGKAGIVLVTAVNKTDSGDTICSQHDPSNSLDGFKYNEIRYGCSIMTVTPDNWTNYKGGAGFAVKWIIKNTGLSTWPAGTDFRFSGGVNMVNGSSIELPAIAPGGTYTAKFNATAPQKAGKYYMTWSVQGMGCDAYLGIIVE
jgi:hypothetical protein